jgi:hypothetical protein
MEVDQKRAPFAVLCNSYSALKSEVCQLAETITGDWFFVLLDDGANIWCLSCTKKIYAKILGKYAAPTAAIMESQDSQSYNSLTPQSISTLSNRLFACITKYHKRSGVTLQEHQEEVLETLSWYSLQVSGLINILQRISIGHRRLK